MRLVLAALTLQLAACAAVAPGTGRAPAAPVPAAPAAAPSAPEAAPAPGAEPAPPAGEGSPAPAAASAPVAAVAATPGAMPRPQAPAPGPPPFAAVIREAKRSEGLFAFWQKDERLWIELRPEDFGRLFFFSPKLATGIGEPPAWGGQMLYDDGFGGGARLVEFSRLHHVVQLLARNADAVAPAGTPQARGVAAAFAPSLLGSAPVASQPHPQSKAVLVDVTGLFVSDVLALAPRLARAYRQGYALDVRNSAITALRHGPGLSVVEVRNHYATGAIAQPQPGASGPVPGMPPRTPSFVPDPRSLLLGLHYSLSKLPDVPMAPRAADPRVGYFSATVRDYADDRARDPRQRHIARWRLEKQDPAAPLSRPVRPITFWLDRNIPEAYRATVREGVLAWNAAFERIGFKDAIVVEQQPDDASFDTLDANRASVRWLADARPGFAAIGPSHVDPRSGEILDADIAVQGLAVRQQRALGRQLGPEAPAVGLGLQRGALPAVGHDHGADLPGAPHAGRCDFGAHAAEQVGYALDVLAAQGRLAPDDPQAEAFVHDFLRWVTAHEIGHALGLRHNFSGSLAYDPQALADPAFTRAFGTSASVMDYPAVNLPRPGAPMVLPFSAALGPYDLWAIEYGYTPAPPGADAQAERRLREAIAARSGRDPRLAYTTDEDAAIGLDPGATTFDLGADPLAFARQRFEIARDVLQRQAERQLPDDEDYASLRRAIAYALRDAGRAAALLARQIGGLHTRRDFPGSGRDPLTPVEARTQRAALDLIAREALAADSLVVPPRLQRRLAPDYLERGDASDGGEAPVATDFSIAALVLDLQRALLVHLMSDAVAQRVLDNAAKLDRSAETFTLAELYERLTRDVWSELGRRDIPEARRELQREHLDRLAAQMLRPASLQRADARGLARRDARQLLARLEASRGGWGRFDAATQAHLQDSLESLRLALAAPLLRGSP